jgi:hypothetical protein
MLFGRNNALICAPEICIADTTSIARRYRTPELLTSRFTPIAQNKRYDLPSFSTQCKPYPGLIGFLTDKRPKLITFERDGTRILRLRWNKRLFQRRQLVGFFLTSRSPSHVQHRTCVPIHASCCALDRHEGFPLFAPPNSRRCSDFHDFAVRMCYNVTSAFRSARYHIYSGLGCRNGSR